MSTNVDDGVVVRDSRSRDRGATPTAARLEDRTGVVSIWAILGLGVVVLVTQGWIRWIASGTEFSPAPILGPDVYPTWREALLRVSELLSVVEMTILVNWAFIRPWRRERRVGLNGMITIGLLLGSFTDGILNMHEYLFAWNAHSVNMGSWASFVPLASPDHQSRYAEALLWGVPQYTYYCITVAAIATTLIERRRKANPGLSNAKAYAAVFGCAAVFDFVLENFFIRVDHAYAFAKTQGALTIFDGSQYQFPLYESVCVASLGVAFTALKLSAIDHPEGLSWPERGVHRLPPRVQTPARALAVIGFCFLCLLFIYHLPVNWLGVTGDSIADLPSYLQPGD